MNLNYGNYGVFLLMGNAGLISSTVVLVGGVAWDLLFVLFLASLCLVGEGGFRI